MAGELRQGKFEERIRVASAGIRGGNPTMDEVAFYERWLASGSPETATDMLSHDAWAEQGYPEQGTVGNDGGGWDYDPATERADGTNIIGNYDPTAMPDTERDPVDFGGTDYGFSGDTVTMYDPFTGQNIEKQVDPNDPHKYTPGRGETKYVWGPNGESMIMDVSQDGWEKFGSQNNSEDSPELGGWQIGYQAPQDVGVGSDLPGNIGNPGTPEYTVPYVPGTGPIEGGGGGSGGGGYENAPQPDGDGSFVAGGPPADTSWDWNYFRDKAPGDRQWGGYDEDYQAFERYQPGMDSPWGMPNIEGGNEDFYQQQFVNQLRDEQGFRNRQRSSEMRAQEAADNPYEAPTSDEMWSWANGGQGLPEVRMGTGQATPTQFEFDDQYADMSLADVWGQVQGLSVFNSSDSSKSQQDVLNNYFNDSNRTDFLGGQDFSSFSNAGEAFASIDPQSWEGMNRPAVAQEGLRTIFNQMYTPTAPGPTAPVGYASPIQWGSSYQS